MGIRSAKRSVAKGRLAAMGVGQINRKLHRKKDNVPLWRAVTEGESGKDAERIQLNKGKLIKARKEQRRRVIRKVSA